MQVQLAFRESARTLGRRRVSMVAGFISTHPGTLPAEGIVALDITTGAAGALTGLGPIQSSYQPDQMHLYGDHFANEMRQFRHAVDMADTQGRGHAPPLLPGNQNAADDPLIGQVYAVKACWLWPTRAILTSIASASSAGQSRKGMPLKGFLGRT